MQIARMPQSVTPAYFAFLGRISPEKAIDQAIWMAKRCGIPLKIAAKVDAVDRDYFEFLSSASKLTNSRGSALIYALRISSISWATRIQ
jgi:hypothetical protein